MLRPCGLVNARIMKLLPHRYPFLLIDKPRFRRPVMPGDKVHIKVKLSNKRAHVWKYWCQAHVEAKKVAEAELGAMLMHERGQ